VKISPKIEIRSPAEISSLKEVVPVLTFLLPAVTVRQSADATPALTHKSSVKIPSKPHDMENL
jgi:hypothetical protein